MQGRSEGGKGQGEKKGKQKKKEGVKGSVGKEGWDLREDRGVALRERGRNNEDKEQRVEVEKEGKKKEERIYYGT